MRLIWAVILLSSCAAERAPLAWSASDSVQVGPSAADETPILRLDTGPLQEPLASQVRWRLAATGDPLELAALAEKVGAMELTATVEAGGPAARIALMALPFAEDAPASLPQLCGWVTRYATPPPDLLLRALHDVVSIPPSQTEQPWAGAFDDCRNDLEAWLAPELSPSSRDLVLSTRAMLGERRFIQSTSGASELSPTVGQSQ